MEENQKMFITWVTPEREFLKVYGQRNREHAVFIEAEIYSMNKDLLRSNGPDPSRVHKGMLCFAKFNDGNFYRGRVIGDVQVQSMVVQVFFIDYGNVDFVSLANIRIANNADSYNLLKLPGQVEEFYLSRVYQKQGEWTQQILDHIKSEICSDELFCKKIMENNGSDRIIQIIYQEEDYSSRLIRLGMAREVTVQMQVQGLLQASKAKAQEVNNQRQQQQKIQPNYSKPPPGLQQPSHNANLSQQALLSQMPKKFGYTEPGVMRSPQVEQQMNVDPRLSIQSHRAQTASVKESSLPVNAVYSPPFTPTQIKEPILQQNVQQPSLQQNIPNIQQNIPNIQQNIPNIQQYAPAMNPLLNAVPQINPLAPLVNNALLEALTQQIKQQLATEEKPKPKPESVPQHYQQKVLEVGSSHTVYISHIDDGPWSFSVQLNEFENHLSSLMDELTEAKRIPIKRPIALGRPCLALSPSTERLYRGVVVNVSHMAVTVFYVDFGNPENIPINNVFELPPKFLKPEAMSQKFALNGLYKVQPSIEINECFEEVVQDQLLLLRVASLEGNNLPTCELYCNQKNIKLILNENVRQIKPEKFPDVGEVEKVAPTWVESPQKFFVQLKKNDEDLEALKNELEQFAANGRKILKDKLKPGLNCVCLYSGDGQWYRAVIKSVQSEQNTVTVFYIDYGNIDTVDPSSLRRIKRGDLITTLNSQAIECCLHGFENVPFDQDAANALEAAILEKTLDLEVVSSDENHIVVNLYDDGVLVNQSFMEPLQTTPQKPVYTPPKAQTGYSPKPLHQNVQEQTHNSIDEWGTTTSPESASTHGDKRQNDRFGDRGGRFNDRNKFEGKPRRFNDSEEDSFGNKNSFDKSRDNWRDDKNKEEDSWRGSGGRRDDRGNEGRKRFNSGDDNRNNSESDWNKPKDNRDFGDRRNRFDDRDKRSDDNWNKPKERGDFGDRRRFDDREKKSDDWGSKQESSPDWESKPSDRGDRGRRFNDRDNRRDNDWNAKKDSNDDWGAKKDSNNDWGAKKDSNNDWGAKKDSNDDWGAKKDSNDDWGSKPKSDFGERKPFGDRGDRDSKFGDRPKKWPVKREDAAPPGSKWYEEPIEIGSTQNGIITYYVSPDDFYFQTISNKEEFTTMMNEIQTYYADRFWFRDPPREDDICIARFPADRVLYRAVVTSTSPLTVQYIDYGNSDKVGPKDVFVVNKKFLDLPKQALRCKLVKVKPTEGDWPAPGSALDQYFEYDDYTCNFVNYVEDNKVYNVELKSGEKDISEEIIQAGLAVPDVDAVAAPVESALPDKLPEFDLALLQGQVYSFYIPYIYNLDKFYVHINPHYAEIVQTHVDNYTAVAENLVPMGRENFEVGKLCISSNGDAYFRARILEISDAGANIHFIDYGDCLEVADDLILGITDQLAAFPPQATECRLLKTSEEEIPQETHDTFKANYEDKNVLFLCAAVEHDPTKLNVMLYEPDGQKLSIVDVNIDESPARINPIGNVPNATQFVNTVFPYFESPKTIYLHRTEDETLLNEFTTNLNTFYNEGNGEDFDCSNPENINQICVAKSLDEMWYRCRLIGNEESANVHYLDYGNMELVPFENVKKLDPSFFQQFIFAWKVEFAIEFDEENLEKINERLGEMTAEKHVVTCFVRKEGVMYAEFLNEEGRRISEVLEDEGLCKKMAGIFDDFDFGKFEVAKTGEKLKIGCELKGFISAMDDNVNTWFCVQLAEDVDAQELFQGKLQEICENLQAETNVPNDEIFAAKFIEDDLWYRAKLRSQNGDSLVVYFIDYGNTAEVNISDGAVKLLTDELKTPPPFVKYCTLDGNWNNEGQEKFVEWLTDVHDEITIVVKDIQDRLIVDLIVNGESIVEKLRNGGFERVVEDVEVIAEVSSDPDAVYVSHTNNLKDFYIQMDKDTEILNKITTELKNWENFENVQIVEVNEIYAAQFIDDMEWYRAKIIKNDGDVEVLFIDYGNTSVASNFKALPDELKNIQAIAHNCELIYPDDIEEWGDEDLNKFLEFVELGELKMKEEKKRGGKLFISLYRNEERIQDLIKTVINPRPSGIITHVNSLTDFYIRFTAKEEEMNIITEKNSEADNFDDLETIDIGTKCAAKFIDDESWYRGEIVKILDDSYEVKFIDYGNISEVYELKKLSDELLKYEPLAINVSLKNATDDVPDSVKEEFIELAISEPQVEFKFLIDDSTTPATCSVRWFGINLEEYLFIEKCGEVNVVPRTDDDKTRLGIVETITNLDDDHRAGGSLTVNETDEEKSVKAAMGTDNEGFKSDDEKGNSEMAVQSLNITDNDLIGEQDDLEEIVDTPDTEYMDVNVETPVGENEESVEEIEEDIHSSSTIQIDKTESDLENVEMKEKSSTESDNEIEKGEVVMKVDEVKAEIDDVSEKETEMENDVDNFENKDDVKPEISPKEMEIESNIDSSPIENDNKSSNDVLTPEDNESSNLDENFADADSETPEKKIINTENGHVNGAIDISYSPDVENKKHETDEDEKTDVTNLNSTINNLSLIKKEGNAFSRSFQRKSLSKDDRLVPGGICRGISNDELERNSSTPILKIPHSEKIIPASISCGILHELIPSEEEKPISVSAPVTPSATRKVLYRKISHQERLVPACISSGSLIEDKPEENLPKPKYEKKPRSEHIIPGVVSGTSSTAEK